MAKLRETLIIALVASLSACMSVQAEEFKGQLTYEFSYGYYLGAVHAFCLMLNECKLTDVYVRDIFSGFPGTNRKYSAQAAADALKDASRYPNYLSCPLPR